ncbi:MAG: ABC transporter substrate-binding protein, partial [Pseudomonadota bacterium]
MIDRILRRGAKVATLGFLVAASLPLAGNAEPVRVGQTFIAGSLDPTQGSTGWALVSHGIAEQLFTVSREGKVVPQLAAGATLNEDGSWTIPLAQGRRFSDGSPVDAQAVVTALNRTIEDNPVSRASAGMISFEAADEMTLSVRTEQPTPILPSILAEWAFPIYRDTGDGFAFSGPFKVEDFAVGAQITLTANPHHPAADTLPDVILQRLADGQTLSLALRAGEVDMAFNLPVETLASLRADPALSAKTFPVAYQYMMFHNTAHPALGDVRVRKAIDMAIDRADLVRAARAGEIATGAFAAIYPFALDEPIGADPEAAAALLDEAGWTLNGDGQREKGGQVLALQLLAYPQRPDLITFQPVVRAALADLGIAVTTQVTEEPSATVERGTFDLALWAQHTAPAGDPLQFLALFFETGAARNYTGWSNETFDSLVEALRQEPDDARRAALAKDAQAILLEEAPVSFLVTPEWHVGLSERLAD